MRPALSITDVYQKQEASFLKHLHTVPHLDEETVHKLRVDIKRIRALLYFLEAVDPAQFNAHRMLKWMRPVFKQAGKIREATLILKSLPLQPSQGLHRFKELIKKKKARHEKEFEKTGRHFDQKKFSRHYKRLVLLVKQPCLLDLSAAYTDSLFADIRQLRANAGNDDTLHRIRKKLKQAKTIDGLLNATSNRFSTAKLKNLEERIGQWHDEVILSESLDRYTKTQDDRNSLNPFLTKVNMRKELLKKRILKQLQLI